MVDGHLLYKHFHMCLKNTSISKKKKKIRQDYRVTVNLLVLIKGKCIFIIAEASICLKNTNHYVKVACDLWSLETELGVPGFRNPFAITTRAE